MALQPDRPIAVYTDFLTSLRVKQGDAYAIGRLAAKPDLKRVPGQRGELAALSV